MKQKKYATRKRNFGVSIMGLTLLVANTHHKLVFNNTPQMPQAIALFMFQHLQKGSLSLATVPQLSSYEVEGLLQQEWHLFLTGFLNPPAVRHPLVQRDLSERLN